MSQSFEFHIGEEESGQRVDGFLAARFGGLSRMRIASLLSAGACLVNRKAARAGLRLVAGDRIEFALAEGAPTAMDPEPVPLEIIYEDGHIVVIVKPAGLLVHPTRNVKQGTLANALVYHLNKDFYEGSGLEAGRPRNQQSRVTGQSHEALRGDWAAATRNGELRAALHGEPHSLVRPGLVHRLDRPTSGLMVIAKTRRALSALSRHFNRRLVQKRYLALVRGPLAEDSATIKERIGRDPERQPHWRVMDGGKEAETRLSVLERYGQATLVELEPVTGRTNQLRIHCAFAGHPIIGDEVYCAGAGPESPAPALRLNELGDGAAPSAVPAGARSRLCLHAWRLAFHHPAGGEWLEFTSPVPEDFASVIARLNHKEGEP
ncbi:MAG: RluA family pseudouridine synthase [Blastocatellia bacterium]